MGPGATHDARATARRKLREEKGFTLVEVMVTMTLTVVFFGMIGTILTSFLTTQKKVEATLLRERVGAAILEVIARDLEGTYVYDVDGAVKGTDERSSGGEADKVEFVTTRDPAVRESDDDSTDQPSTRAQSFSDGTGDQDAVPHDPPRLSKIVYSTRDSRHYPGLLTLFRSETLFIPPLPSATGTSAGRATNGSVSAALASVAQKEPTERFMEVYDRVKSFNVRYLKVDRTQQSQGGAPAPGEWKDSWDDPQDTPVAFEVTLEIIADPKSQNGEGQDRVRKVYKTTIAVPVTKPLASSTGASTGLSTGR